MNLIRSTLKIVARRYLRADLLWTLSSWAWIGPAFAVAILLLARLRPLVYARPLALLAALIFCIGLIGWQWLQRPSLFAAAMRIDRDLSLKDRLSSALSLDSSLNSNESEVPKAGLFGAKGLPESTSSPASPAQELLRRQLADAKSTAEDIDVRRAISIQFDRSRTGLGSGPYGACYRACLPSRIRKGSSWPNSKRLKKSAELLAEAIEEQREAIQEDQDISEEDKATLDGALKDLQESLKDSNGKIDNDLAALAEAESKLEELRDPAELNKADRAERISQQLSTLAQSNAKNQNSEGRNADAEEGDLSSLAAAAESMSEAEREALAEELEAMAKGAGIDNPEAAEALENLADALREGDDVAANAAAQQAQEALSEAARSASAAQSAQNSMAQIQEGRQALAKANSSAQPADPSLAQSARGTNRPSQRSPSGRMAQASRQNGESSQAQQQARRARAGWRPGAGAKTGSGRRTGPGRRTGSGRRTGPGRRTGSGRRDRARAKDRDKARAKGRARDKDKARLVDPARLEVLCQSGEASGGASAAGGSPGSDQSAAVGQKPVLGSPAMIYAPSGRLQGAGQGEQSFVPGRGQGERGQRMSTERETRNPGLRSPSLVPYDSVYSRYRDAAWTDLRARGYSAGLARLYPLIFRTIGTAISLESQAKSGVGIRIRLRTQLKRENSYEPRNISKTGARNRKLHRAGDRGGRRPWCGAS